MHALSVHPAPISQYLRINFISTSVTSETLGLHESGMSWSGQAHVMNNMYGSSYNSNMSSAAAATHGAFFRYMRHPTVKQENNKYISLIFCRLIKIHTVSVCIVPSGYRVEFSSWF